MTPKLQIKRPHDEKIEIYYDEKLVTSANHDEHGWSGMYEIEYAVRTFAALLDIEVEEV